MLVLPSDNSELFIDCGGGGRIDFLDFLPLKFHRVVGHPFASIAFAIRLPNNGSGSLIFPIHEGTTWLALYAIYVAVIKSRDVLRMPITDISCDPFNDAERCHYIDPSIDLLARDSVSFGVFQGHLRIFQSPCHQYPHNDGAYKFYVWELENYGTWCLKHKVYFKDTVSDHSDLVKIANGITPPRALLAFHPNASEIVFLQLGNYIVLCNMMTRVLKVVSELRDGGKILAGNSSYGVSVYAKSVFLLTQPSWPTPVPPLPFH
nr:hypothetical protein CFP56_51002 [Quercus suber]POE93134.1 hypothetical protein CFP56_40288 [Quercus suber]